MATIVLVQKILFSFFPFLVYVLSTRFPLAKKKKLQQKISVLVFMAITEAICLEVACVCKVATKHGKVATNQAKGY